MRAPTSTIDTARQPFPPGVTAGPGDGCAVGEAGTDVVMDWSPSGRDHAVAVFGLVHVRVGDLGLVAERGDLNLESRQPVPDYLLQVFFGHVPRLRQCQVERVMVPVKLGESRVPDGGQGTTPRRRDLVDGPLGLSCSWSLAGHAKPPRIPPTADLQPVLPARSSHNKGRHPHHGTWTGRGLGWRHIRAARRVDLQCCRRPPQAPSTVRTMYRDRARDPG